MAGCTLSAHLLASPAPLRRLHREIAAPTYLLVAQRESGKKSVLDESGKKSVLDVEANPIATRQTLQ